MSTVAKKNVNNNETIVALRKSMKLSQAEFAKKFHIGVKTLQSWEQGWRNCPDDTIFMIKSIVALEKKNAALQKKMDKLSK